MCTVYSHTPSPNLELNYFRSLHPCVAFKSNHDLYIMPAHFMGGGRGMSHDYSREDPLS